MAVTEQDIFDFGMGVATNFDVKFTHAHEKKTNFSNHTVLLLFYLHDDSSFMLKRL